MDILFIGHVNKLLWLVIINKYNGKSSNYKITEINFKYT